MLQIELDRVRNDGLSEKNRDAVESTIKAALLQHYGSDLSATDAYLDHWERLNAGDPAAENGDDEWSQTMCWALTRCEGIFDNWHSVPPLVPTIVL